MKKDLICIYLKNIILSVIIIIRTHKLLLIEKYIQVFGLYDLLWNILHFFTY